MNRHRTSIALAVLLAVAIAATGVAFVGLASADHSTAEQENSTVNLTADSYIAYAEVTDTGGADTHVNFVGVDSNGNETNLSTVTVAPPSGESEVASYKLADNDSTDYDKIKMEIVGDVTPSAVAYGTIEGSNELMNETTTIGNDTVTAWAEVTNTSSTDAYLAIYGVDSDGTETIVFEAVLNAAPNSTDFAEYEFRDIDIDVYDSVRFSLEGESVESTDYGTTVSLSGGSSATTTGFLQSETAGVTNWILILFGTGVAGLAYKGKDE